MDPSESKEGEVKEEGGNVQVMVRCRPLSELEKQGNFAVHLSVPSQDEVKVRLGKGKIAGNSTATEKNYTFDHVFGQYSTQEDVFKTAVQPVVEEVLNGFNCTIFAYGQTGTGKTHTMEGSLSADSTDKNAGIIPRCVHTIFERLQSNYSEFSVKVSFLELYNEELSDLLTDNQDSQLRIFEDATGKSGMMVSGLEELICTSAEQVFKLLKVSQNRRQVAATLLNKNSSRSHCVFTLTIHTKEAGIDGEDIIKLGKLYLVDLAGSECVGRSGAQNQRAKEAGKINQSLLTLGRVINALVDKAGYVPYRDSKLTRLLQESLGGRAKTLIIATVSPSAVCIDETVSTLEYANRAKHIKNKPQVNQKLTKKSYMKELVTQIARLKAENEALRGKNGIYMPPDQYEELTEGYKGKCDLLAELECTLAAKEKEYKEMQESFDNQVTQLIETQEQKAAVETKLFETEKTLVHVKDNLSHVEEDLEVTEFVVKQVKRAEDALRSEAVQLHSTLTSVIDDKNALHMKVSRKQFVEDHNLTSMQMFNSNVQKRLAEMQVDGEQAFRQAVTFLLQEDKSLQSFLASHKESCISVADGLRKTTRDLEVDKGDVGIIVVSLAEILKGDNSSMREAMIGELARTSGEVNAVQVVVDSAALDLQTLLKSSKATHIRMSEDVVAKVDSMKMEASKESAHHGKSVEEQTRSLSSRMDSFAGSLTKQNEQLSSKVLTLKSTGEDKLNSINKQLSNSTQHDKACEGIIKHLGQGTQQLLAAKQHISAGFSEFHSNNRDTIAVSKKNIVSAFEALQTAVAAQGDANKSSMDILKEHVKDNEYRQKEITSSVVYCLERQSKAMEKDCAEAISENSAFIRSSLETVSNAAAALTEQKQQTCANLSALEKDATQTVSALLDIVSASKQQEGSCKNLTKDIKESFKVYAKDAKKLNKDADKYVKEFNKENTNLTKLLTSQKQCSIAKVDTLKSSSYDTFGNIGKALESQKARLTALDMATSTAYKDLAGFNSSFRAKSDQQVMAFSTLAHEHLGERQQRLAESTTMLREFEKVQNAKVEAQVSVLISTVQDLLTSFKTTQQAQITQAVQEIEASLKKDSRCTEQEYASEKNAIDIMHAATVDAVATMNVNINSHAATKDSAFVAVMNAHDSIASTTSQANSSVLQQCDDIGDTISTEIPVVEAALGASSSKLNEYYACNQAGAARISEALENSNTKQQQDVADLEASIKRDAASMADHLSSLKATMKSQVDTAKATLQNEVSAVAERCANAVKGLNANEQFSINTFTKLQRNFSLHYTEAVNLAESMTNDISNSCAEATQQVQAMDARSKEFTKSFSSNTSRHVASVDTDFFALASSNEQMAATLLEEMAQMEVKLTTSAVADQKSLEQLRSDIMINTAATTQQVDSLKSDVVARILSIDAALKEEAGLVEQERISMKDMITKSFQESKKRVASMVDSVSKSAEQQIDAMTQSLEKSITGTSALLVQKVSALHVSVDSQTSRIMQKIKEQVSLQKKRCADLTEQVEKGESRIVSALDQLAVKGSVNLNTQLQNLSDLSTFTVDKCQEWLVANAEEKSRISEFNMNLEQKQSSIARMVDNLVERDIQRDLPTGTTPQKREFSYPSRLTKSRDSTVISADYAARKKVIIEMQKTRLAEREYATSPQAKVLDENGEMNVPFHSPQLIGDTDCMFQIAECKSLSGQDIGLTFTSPLTRKNVHVLKERRRSSRGVETPLQPIATDMGSPVVDEEVKASTEDDKSTVCSDAINPEAVKTVSAVDVQLSDVTLVIDGAPAPSEPVNSVGGASTIAEIEDSPFSAPIEAMLVESAPHAQTPTSAGGHSRVSSKVMDAAAAFIAKGNTNSSRNISAVNSRMKKFEKEGVSAAPKRVGVRGLADKTNKV